MLDSTSRPRTTQSRSISLNFLSRTGWDRHTSRLEIPVDGQTFNLAAVAQKRGMVAFSCDAQA